MIIDTCATERRTRSFRRAIENRTAVPVRTIVNTHHHGDHTLGNWLFDAATVIGHTRTRVSAIAAGVSPSRASWTPFEIGEVHLAPPTVTFESELTVWVDDVRCDIRHVGTAAHTDNDCIVWLPEQKILFAGDVLFSRTTPFLMGGSLSGSIEVLETVVRPLDALTIVAGHGPVGGPEVIEDVLDYLHWLTEVSSDAHTAGLTPLEASRSVDLGRFSEWLDPERLVANIYRAYAEIDGGDRGSDIDRRAAMEDMIAYNGGRRLTCSA